MLVLPEVLALVLVGVPGQAGMLGVPRAFRGMVIGCSCRLLKCSMKACLLPVYGAHGENTLRQDNLQGVTRGFPDSVLNAVSPQGLEEN